jgi:NAD(P)-dependent dehydrogenase (short-subunit alcohol dehydrogenase family)
MDLGLRDRVAIVTGASGGIGRAVALELAAEGCAVIVCARSEDGLRAVLDELPSGSSGRIVAGDVRDPRTGEQLVSTASNEFGRLDILVNNAGRADPKRLDALTDTDWLDAFDLNLFAAIRLAAACVPLMRAGGWGRIVNVASTHGREPDPWFAPYSAAKAALINFTKTYGRAYAYEGILTSCLVPGITETELVAHNTANAAAAADVDEDEIVRRMLVKDPIPAGRFARVEEVAAAAVFLASERASYVTGSGLVVDGGALRSP